MAFESRHRGLIWDSLFTVIVPDLLTQNKDYLRVYGAYQTGNKAIDSKPSALMTTVMIPIAKMLEYFTDGIEVEIPSREDMIQIHKNIELYLEEWKEHIKFDINLQLDQYKQMIIDLERLSKYIYDRASGREVIDKLFVSKKFGIADPFTAKREADKPQVKPDYQGIASLVRTKTTKPLGRF